MSQFKRTSRLALTALLSVTMLAGCGILGGGDKPKTTPTVGNRVPVLSRIDVGAAVDPALASVPVILPAQTINPDYAQPGGNAAKTVGHLALADTPSRVWTTSIAGSSKRVRLAAAPVVANGRLYVTDTDAEVYAIDAATGARVWSTSLGVKGDGATSVFGGGVSVDGARVYATTGYGEVAAINAADGSVIWKVRPAGPLRGAPTLAFNAVFVMTQDNQLISLDSADGAMLWNETASVGQTGVFGVGAPAAGQGTVVAGFSSGELVAYRYENGRNLWSDALARTSISTSVSSLSDIDADPIIDRSRVYALGQGGRMAAYELVTGQRIWELNVAGISTPAIAGEWIFTLTVDARLLCIARASGKVRWVAQMQRFKDEKDKKGPINWTGPMLAGNRLIVASTEGDVMSVSPSDGTVSSLFELNSAVSLPPVVANSMLYILDDGGQLSAFR